MPLTLHVDGERWRAHLRGVLERNPGLVPVVKGNGYGFGLTRLAGEAQRLGVQTIAVGTPDEVAQVRRTYAGDVVVLEPWHPALTAGHAGDPRVIRTVAHPEAVRAFTGTYHRVVVEVRTSMQRHGLESLDGSAGLRSEGWALHLPLAGDAPGEVRRIVERLPDEPRDVWVSHLLDAPLDRLRRQFPERRFRPRVGTALWLGDPAALKVRSTVIDVHRLPRGTKVGYRQHRMIKDGDLVVVSGGTAHGVGLEAPKPVPNVEVRAKVLAAGALGAAGLTLSPFTIGGRQRWFAEPPHMQVSLVLVPDDVPMPAIGEEIPVQVRNTIATFDRITGL
jgi:hypothetical protein